MTELEIPGAPKPYHIAYKVTEVEVNDAAASLGQTTSKRNRHFVNLEARVRVGVSGPRQRQLRRCRTARRSTRSSRSTCRSRRTPRIARRAAWLVTDARLQGGAACSSGPSSRPRAPSGARPTDVPAGPPRSRWSARSRCWCPSSSRSTSSRPAPRRSRRCSAITPEIRDSRVAVTSYLERRWYLTTEGTSVTDTRRASGVVIAASGQADDGQALAQYFLRYGHTAQRPAHRRRAPRPRRRS